MAARRDDVDALLAALQRGGHDFREYRRDTIERRIADWIDVAGIEDLDHFCAEVEGNPQMLAAVADFFRVSTSLLFRDREIFEALETVVVPRLSAATAHRTLRAWVAGVATGEEAWSLAMILDARVAAGGRPVEIFASDISTSALDVARVGRYRAAEATGLPGHLRAYVVEDGDDVVMCDALRRHVTFCHHDLLGPALAPAAAVLATFDLILCRNVLIYLEERLQHRLLHRLVAQLAPHGVLGLGPYEDVPPAFGPLVQPLAGVDPSLHLFTPRCAA